MGVFSTANNTKIVGAIIPVVFPEFSNQTVLAKVDTGAYTGALHYSKLVEVKGKEGKVNLEFTPLGTNKSYTVDNFVVNYVKSSNGAREKRYFIDTKIVIDNQTYKIRLSLANRGNMKYLVLIGRRFLIKNKFIVDVNHRKKLERKS